MISIYKNVVMLPLKYVMHILSSGQHSYCSHSNMSATYKTRITSTWLPLRYVRHIRLGQYSQAPTQNMSSTYIKFRKLLSSHSVSCKCMFPRYFGEFQNPLIINQI